MFIFLFKNNKDLRNGKPAKIWMSISSNLHPHKVRKTFGEPALRSEVCTVFSLLEDPSWRENKTELQLQKKIKCYSSCNLSKYKLIIFHLSWLYSDKLLCECTFEEMRNQFWTSPLENQKADQTVQPLLLCMQALLAQVEPPVQRSQSKVFRII